MIAKNLDFEIYSSSNCRLINTDNIRKIVSSTCFPDVAFLIQTQFSYLVNFYKNMFKKSNMETILKISLWRFFNHNNYKIFIILIIKIVKIFFLHCYLLLMFYPFYL